MKTIIVLLLATTVSAQTVHKIVLVNLQQAVFTTVEGRQATSKLNKETKQKQDELKAQNEKVVVLEQQLKNQQGLSEMDLYLLRKQIDEMHKLVDASSQNIKQVLVNEQNTYTLKIFQKMLPMIRDYAKRHGTSIVIDSSKPWPQSPLLWSSPSIDITKEIVKIYDQTK